MLYEFILPLGPFFKLYANKFSERLAWLLYYAIPFLLILKLQQINILPSIIGILTIYSAYDVGYIYNNTETIKKENSPTLRYKPKELVYYEENKKIIYICKVLFSIFFAFILSYFFSYDLLTWLLIIVLIISVFFIYNSIRGISNFYLQILLTISRFSLPIYILSGSLLNVFFLTVLLFPLPNFLERTSIKTNNFPFKVKNISKFRVVYYLLLLLFSFLLFRINVEYTWFLWLAIYYFIYRVLFYLFKNI